MHSKKARKELSRKARPKHLHDVDAIDKQQKNATRMIDTLALLAKPRTCSDPRRQDELLNRIYRWEMVMQLRDGILTASPPETLSADVSYRLYLRSESSKTLWVPWIEIKPSNIQGAGMGVFAMREFTKGQAIGWYYGKARNSSIPRDDNSAMYQMANIDAQGGIGFPGRLGMHFLNDPTMNLQETRDINKAKKMWNVELESDYAVVAKRQIRIGDELYADYNREWIVAEL